MDGRAQGGPWLLHRGGPRRLPDPDAGVPREIHRPGRAGRVARRMRGLLAIKRNACDGAVFFGLIAARHAARTRTLTRPAGTFSRRREPTLRYFSSRSNSANISDQPRSAA